MSLVKWDLAGMDLVGAAVVTISSATTTSFDFGTPNDLDISASSVYDPGDRLLVVLTASTAGSTDSLTWVIQDADDSSGSIGTPATAVTSAVEGALAAGTGGDYSAFAVKVQFERPWLRVRVTSDGANDTFVTHCTVWSVHPNT